MKKILLALPLIFFLLTSRVFSQPEPGTGTLASTPVEIKNHGFELSGADHQPSYWELSSANTIGVDPQLAAFGTKSLVIEHREWQQSVAISEPLKLKVGHLYRASAWVKTEEAYSDPAGRYPTPVAGCISMESFPFTNHSPATGGSRDWEKIEVLFLATKATDRIRLHFGYNGNARGKIWFDQVGLEKVEDISQYIPLETVRWFQNGFRYDDRGWIFVHIEGAPYERGYQYGYLVADEMIAYLNKLAIEANEKNPEQGWADTRFIADAFFLRKYETEFLTEMRGIADGANHAGVKLFDRPLDLIDVVTLNSVIDIEWARYAMPTTAHPLSGQNFLKQEDELNLPNRLHKCSSFLANQSSTTDRRIVFGQLFMWGGYTGVHWNVICDVVPSSGHRLVYQTFPGGIHSGSDFYINAAGIMIGETTVEQTPFNPDGTPQSNRIRKAAQYASNIDQVVKILATDNNGMYANDWLIGDTKTDEIAVLLLGTYRHKLWRSSRKEFYGDTRDFYWCNNNPKELEVRKEYVPNADNAPRDLIFAPWNRDLAFNRFYQEQKGKMDAVVGARGLATSPINRPHACDGKVTTSEMAEQLVFLAHSGKVTLREKFVNENRRIPDLPGAEPRLTLGYAVISPIFVSEKIKALKKQSENPEAPQRKEDFSDEMSDRYAFPARMLWFNTVYPASPAENWFISGTSAYWKILKNLPESPVKIATYLQPELAELNSRYRYLTQREGTLAARQVQQKYDRYNHYQIPRIKGTYLLHQLRLLIGNQQFSELMNDVHQRYREKEMTTENFIGRAEKISGKKLSAFFRQWLDREDLPDPAISASIDQAADGWQVLLEVSQPEKPYQFITSIGIETSEDIHYHLIQVQEAHHTFNFRSAARPERLVFNALNDVPLPAENYFTWSNFFDDFHQGLIVYGTSRQIEANHTLALRFSTVLADRFTETLMPVVKDAELSEPDMRNQDLIILGSASDNRFMHELIEKFDLSVGKNWFSWQQELYTQSDHGLFLAYPNPFNPQRTVYLFIANSAMQLYQMTRDRYSMPSWAIYQGNKIIKKGYHLSNRQEVTFR